jgi:hypothetical protein
MMVDGVQLALGVTVSRLTPEKIMLSKAVSLIGDVKNAAH